VVVSDEVCQIVKRVIRVGLNFVEEKLDVKGFKNVEKCVPNRPGVKFELFG
jgi:hypothetical protein